MLSAEEKSKADSRERIITATTDLFLEKGFAGTSMSTIAKASDMTKASLYYHFSGKEDLFIACVTHGYAAALDALTVITANASLTAEQKLRAAIDALYDTTITSPVGRMSPLIAEVSRAFPKVARSFHTEYIEPQRAALWQIVEEGVAQGVFARVDQNQFFHLAFGPIVTLSLSREMFATFDDLDTHFPVDDLRHGHTEVLIGMLR
ncbi:MAG: TetR/AcrR family transcriptional regulator [Pseudomonadota bacterium]